VIEPKEYVPSDGSLFLQSITFGRPVYRYADFSDLRFLKNGFFRPLSITISKTLCLVRVPVSTHHMAPSSSLQYKEPVFLSVNITPPFCCTCISSDPSMVSFTFSHLTTSLLVLANLCRVVSTPVVNEPELQGLDNNARDTLDQLILSGPRWMVYSDQFTPGITGPPPLSQIDGFNVLYKHLVHICIRARLISFYEVLFPSFSLVGQPTRHMNGRP
jgi:hypothetical protein